mgnify:CR=1 FL=1
MEDRYKQIYKLINEEIDEIMTNTDEGYPTEMDRDDMIAHYLDFLRKDLQSDNA